MEHRAALQKKVDQHSAWVSQRAIERKEGVFAHDLKVVSASSKNMAEKAAIFELLAFRKELKPASQIKGFEHYLAEIQQGDLSRLHEFKKAITWATSEGVTKTVLKLEMKVDWDDPKLERHVFYVLENISQVVENELEKTKYSEVEKIKKLADFGDFVRERTDLLYSDYLQKRLTPFYEREKQRKEHLEAMHRIDPNYMRGNSHSEPEPQKQKPNRDNDFSM
jgi:hypothetical protein